MFSLCQAAENNRRNKCSSRLRNSGDEGLGHVATITWCPIVTGPRLKETSNMVVAQQFLQSTQSCSEWEGQVCHLFFQTVDQVSTTFSTQGVVLSMLIGWSDHDATTRGLANLLWVRLNYVISTTCKIFELYNWPDILSLRTGKPSLVTQPPCKRAKRLCISTQHSAGTSGELGGLAKTLSYISLWHSLALSLSLRVYLPRIILPMSI